MTITVKEKELVAVGISVAAGCKPCTDYHLKAARKARASDSEIEHAVAYAVAVRERATQVMQGYALSQLGDAGHGDEPVPTKASNRLRTLVSIGAAFGVNCVTSLEGQLVMAEGTDISRDDIEKVVKLAAFIKRKAASHVERLVGLTKEEATQPAGELSEMMKQCCGKEGMPDFEKMKQFMQNCGKKEFSEDDMAMMKQLCGQQGIPDAEKMKEMIEKCGCHVT